MGVLHVGMPHPDAHVHVAPSLLHVPCPLHVLPASSVTAAPTGSGFENGRHTPHTPHRRVTAGCGKPASTQELGGNTSPHRSTQSAVRFWTPPHVTTVPLGYVTAPGALVMTGDGPQLDQGPSRHRLTLAEHCWTLQLAVVGGSSSGLAPSPSSSSQGLVVLVRESVATQVSARDRLPPPHVAEQAPHGWAV